MKSLTDETILITGSAGQIGLPLAQELARHNKVWAIDLFTRPSVREQLESAGVTTRALDLAEEDYGSLPDKFSYVIHLAVSHGDGKDFDSAIHVNAESTGGLMSRFRRAKAFLIMSSIAVYTLPSDPTNALAEINPLGGSVQPFSPTYATSKLAQEAVVRFCALEWNIPTTIARMSVAYGPAGGLPAYHFDMIRQGIPIPVDADGFSVCTPIHQADINAQAPGMLAAANVPATIVNWGGDDIVDVETYCTYMGQLHGFSPEFLRTTDGPRFAPTDNSLRQRLVGPCKMDWQRGLKSMIELRHPDLRTGA